MKSLQAPAQGVEWEGDPLSVGLQNLEQCVVMRICPIPSFPVSFPRFSMLHLQVPQGKISQLWDGSRVGFCCPLGPAEHRAGQEGSRWMLGQL